MHLSSLVVWSAIMSSTASNFGGVGDTNGGIATGHGIQGLPIAPARGVLGDEARPHGVLATEYGVGDYITTDIDGNVHVGKVLSVDKGTKTVQVQLLVGGASGAVAVDEHNVLVHSCSTAQGTLKRTQPFPVPSTRELMCDVPCLCTCTAGALSYACCPLRVVLCVLSPVC